MELTESETEYVVRCIKHTFKHNVVFQVRPLHHTHACTHACTHTHTHTHVLTHTQFDVTNTLNDQLLEGVYVEMEEAEGFSVVSHVPIPKLSYGQPATTYTLVEMADSGVGE